MVADFHLGEFFIVRAAKRVCCGIFHQFEDVLIFEFTRLRPVLKDVPESEILNQSVGTFWQTKE